jgi:hypothetical protein
MKSVLMAAMMLLSVGAMAQTAADVKFNKVKHSFGKIPKGTPVTTMFTFTNGGAKPLIIENANAECGCTTPEYGKAPVMKGKTGTVKATFNAATPGPFTKKVNVKFANIKDPVVVTLEGEVVEGKVASAKKG